MRGYLPLLLITGFVVSCVKGVQPLTDEEGSDGAQGQGSESHPNMSLEPGGDSSPSDEVKEDPELGVFYRPRAWVAQECRDSTVRGAENVGLRRLTKRELLKALQDTIAADFSYPELEIIKPFVDVSHLPYDQQPTGQVLMNGVPADHSERPGESFQELFSYEQLSAWSRFIDWLAVGLAESSWASTLVPAPCFRQGESDAGSSACFSALVDVIAPRAFRRSVAEDDKAAIVSSALEATEWTAGVQRVVAQVFVSPYFMHDLALGGEDNSQNGRVRLTAEEVANRLALALTGRPPDQELTKAAESGELSDIDKLRAHAGRIIRTDAAQEKLMGMFVEWLGLDAHLKPWYGWMHFNNIEPSEQLSSELSNEVISFIKYIVWEQEGTYRDLMTKRVAFATTKSLQAIYRAERMTSSEPVSAPNHPGLLTRAFLLASSGTENNPIARAVRVKTNILCQYVPDPDFSTVTSREEDLKAADPVRTPGHEIVTELTADESCAGCHLLINPVGYLFEAYNPIGQRQDVQQVVRHVDEWSNDITEPEQVINEYGVVAEFPLPVNQSFSVEGGGMNSYDDVDSLIGDIAGSTRGRACMMVRFFRHAHRRSERQSDACALQEGTDALATRPVLDAFVAGLVNEDIYWRGGE